MLELDLVLNAFLNRHYSSLTAPEMVAFVALLDRTDADLWDRIIIGRPGAAGDDPTGILRRLRDCSPLSTAAGGKRA